MGALLNMRVSVTSKAFSKNDYLIRYLSENFLDINLNNSLHKLSDDELIVFLKDSDAVILALEEINERVLRALPNLQVISKFGVGLDNIDFAACQKYGVKVLHRPGVNRFAVAELTLCLTISLFRNVFYTASKLSTGNWIKNGGRGLFGKTIGIIGFGNAGMAFADLLAPFDCNLKVVDILDKKLELKKYKAEQVNLEDLLKASDLISIHVPLTIETVGMVNHSFLDAMKESGYLINTARGEVVDLIALREALLNNKIAGAALDVYDVEPPTDYELLRLDNLIPTPHIAGNSYEATKAMGESAVDLLCEYFKERNN